MPPPMAIANKTNPIFDVDTKAAQQAKIIPQIPNKFPPRELLADDSPFNAKIKHTAAIK